VYKILIILFSLVVTDIALAKKNNVIQLEGTTIKANSEQPHVLYLLPWKRPQGTGRLQEEIRAYPTPIKPVDRQVLKREADFYKQLHGIDND
jgi:predicted O-linked N-acetylglucosamine transferase (SPINDLY family)